MAKKLSDISQAVHELQAPLTLLRARLETALGAEWCRGDCRELIRLCLEEAESMNQIVVDLLLLQKAESDEPPIEYQRFDMAELIRAVGKSFAPLAEKRELRFEVEAKGSLPVMGDESGLRRALVNILDNAFKCTPPGGSVSVECRCVGERMELAIKDTGRGIPPEAVPHVFERFYQVDKAGDHDAGGVGLGLAIARALVERHRGTARVESTPGKGSVFTLTFPLATDDI
jgi:two-component system phosphate regulon sensor histidine kinase PhoR